MRDVSYGRFIKSLAFCERMFTLFVALFLHCGFICVVLVERVGKWVHVLSCVHAWSFYELPVISV
jgi:hypothetical protein